MRGASKTEARIQVVIMTYYYRAKKQTTTANRATPSTNAAMIIMFIRISPADSGWRAIASIAEPPILPIPIPAPTAAIPAPIAAPNLPNPKPAAAACNNTVLHNFILRFILNLI